MLASSSDSVLLVVDIQQRLAAAMPEDARERVFRNAGILIRAASRLEVPCLVSEQYPKGLGPTDPAVTAHVDEATPRFEKNCFSCFGADGLADQLKTTGRRQLVLAGMEAHVCVLQSAIEMSASGWRVFVVSDATCSRNPDNHANAMDRLRQAGIVVTNTESVLFEWLRDASHPAFKELSKLVR